MKPGKLLGPLRDKRVQIAAAGAAVLGLVVFMRNGGGAVKAQPAPEYDSTGSDLATAVQAAQDGWSNDLRAFTDQLRDLNSQLGQRPSSGTGADLPTYPRPGGASDRPGAVTGPWVGAKNAALEAAAAAGVSGRPKRK